jgi:DNA-directed RNA polymerase specialized sigma24 family protein
METTLSEKELIGAMENRDPSSVGALYDSYAATLFKIICCHISDRQTAEEILASTILEIWANIQSYHQQDKRLLIWMAGIARNRASRAQIT